MSFASDITDALQLPSPCSCAAHTPTYNTTRTDRYSYEKRYRIERFCLASQTNTYQLFKICINNTSSTGYAVGNYIQVAYGTPSLLLYIKTVNGSGGITGITVVNSPTYNSLPNQNISPTTLSGSGQGAVLNIVVTANRNNCCSCATEMDETGCTGANITVITF
jgi:hypothetical protein